MTDAFVSSSAHVAKRYRSERRFQTYGLISLGVTVAFLVFLLLDIVTKGLPAFTEHTMNIPVAVSAISVDAAAPEKGEYSTLVKEALKSAFPAVTNRADKKALLGLLSSGASDDLREMVVANPTLIGTDVTLPLLMSADADLYLKGNETGIEKRSGIGALQLTKTGDAYTVTGDITGIHEQSILRLNGGALRVSKVNDVTLETETLLELTSAGAVVDGKWDQLLLSVKESDRRINDREAVYLEALKDQGVISKNFSWRLFSSGDSREPELSGIKGALVGSLLTLIVALSICVPIGVAAAIYLEEFAAKGRLTNLIEVNINNLAAVPSIIFGLLGLAVFLNFFGMPRSAPLVGGFVLALLVLPTIIIAARAAFRSVPPSIKEAALGVGASHQQAVFHHVLPLAVPGILTGVILGVSRALGETAPLLMIGMIAFIVDVPTGFTDAATVLPVQIFLWSDLPEIAFQSRTAAAIMILMCVLFVLNAIAIFVRKRFERRW